MIIYPRWNVPIDIALSEVSFDDKQELSVFVLPEKLNDPICIFVHKDYVQPVSMNISPGTARALADHLNKLADAFEKAEWVKKWDDK